MKLRILQYNIQLMFPFVIEEKNNHRSLEISNFIGTNYSDIDVITFCEGFDKAAREILILNLYDHGFKYTTPVIGDHDNCFPNGGVFIVSKYPILQTNFHIFKNCTGTDSLVNKGIVKAVIIKEYTPVHIFATHLQAWSDNITVRDRQIQELHWFINYFNIPKDDIVIVSGDFNTCIDHIEKHSRYILVQPKIVTSQKYTEDPSTNSLVGVDGGDPNIYKRLKSNPNSYPESCKRYILDYVFYSSENRKPVSAYSEVIRPKTKVYKIKLWKLGWLSSVNLFTDDLSDHYPVLCTMEF